MPVSATHNCPTCGSSLQFETTSCNGNHMYCYVCIEGLTDEEKKISPYDTRFPGKHSDGSTRLFHVRFSLKKGCYVLVKKSKSNFRTTIGSRRISLLNTEIQWILSKSDVPKKLERKLNRLERKMKEYSKR